MEETIEKAKEQLLNGWLKNSSYDIAQMSSTDRCFCGSDKRIFECHYNLYKKIKSRIKRKKY